MLEMPAEWFRRRVSKDELAEVAERYKCARSTVERWREEWIRANDKDPRAAPPPAAPASPDSSGPVEFDSEELPPEDLPDFFAEDQKIPPDSGGEGSKPAPSEGTQGGGHPAPTAPPPLVLIRTERLFSALHAIINNARPPAITVGAKRAEIPPIGPEAAEKLGKDADPLVAKYLPQIDAYGLEINFALTALEVYGPFVAACMEYRKFMQDHRIPAGPPRTLAKGDVESLERAAADSGLGEALTLRASGRTEEVY